MAVNNPGPAELWKQAGGGTPTYDRDRYRALLIEHGHLIPGTPEPLPCGWPGPAQDSADAATDYWADRSAELSAEEDPRPEPVIDKPEWQAARTPTVEEADAARLARQRRDTLDHLREQALRQKAAANRGQGELVDEVRGHWSAPS